MLEGRVVGGVRRGAERLALGPAGVVLVVLLVLVGGDGGLGGHLANLGHLGDCSCDGLVLPILGHQVARSVQVARLVRSRLAGNSRAGVVGLSILVAEFRAVGFGVVVAGENGDCLGPPCLIQIKDFLLHSGCMSSSQTHWLITYSFNYLAIVPTSQSRDPRCTPPIRFSAARKYE